jgi:hypothetical protein
MRGRGALASNEAPGEELIAGSNRPLAPSSTIRFQEVRLSCRPDDVVRAQCSRMLSRNRTRITYDEVEWATQSGRIPLGRDTAKTRGIADVLLNRCSQGTLRQKPVVAALPSRILRIMSGAISVIRGFVLVRDGDVIYHCHCGVGRYCCWVGRCWQTYCS